MDPLTKAWRREKRAKQVRPPVLCAEAFAFTCAVCGKGRGERHRRRDEPDSEICTLCIKLSGFTEEED